MHCRIEKFCIVFRKLITIIELQYCTNLRGNFNLTRSENLSISFDRQSIMSMQLFFNVTGWKGPSNHLQRSECFIFFLIRFFCLNHKVDFCLAIVSLQMLIYMIIQKCLTLYFHHDSPWSNARMIAVKCWVENVLEKKTDCTIL